MLNTRTIQDWLVTKITEHLQAAPESIDIHEPFSSYGLTSLDVVSLSGDLEEWLDRRLPPTLAYEYPDIFSLSRYLASGTESLEPDGPVVSINGNSAEPIAIIGIACRFPGAADPESFWQLLRDGIDSISEIPKDRWQKEAFYHPDPAVAGKSVSKWGGFLEHIDQFDPHFFGISPMEAEYMDPQQRLLLELACEALDDAGQVHSHTGGNKTGVFMGISVNEYSHIQMEDPSVITSHSGTGSALSIAANRISYFFNFHGPSMVIDTACSSSLAAVHLACQSLRSGECAMALAGGVNLILSPVHSIAFSKAGVLAPDGRCKSFDARANGYVRGEGGGVLVLKPLSVAMADGNPVHALIIGSAQNQDGRTNGLIAPSREAQEALLQEAYRAAGIPPGSVQYVEAHGTGTLLGDLMEARALGAVIGRDRTGGPCSIGSVKTNIGHLEAAAGIAGLIKVILSLKYQTLPPSLHYHSPNPHILFNELNLRVQSELNAWPSGGGPAVAGVSSFGFGGTNVHVVVREAGIEDPNEESKEDLHSTASNCYLLPLSANSSEGLKLLAGTFQQLLAPESSFTLNDVCYAAAIRRSQQDFRLSVKGNSRKELHDGLEAYLLAANDPHVSLGSELPYSQPKLAFVFSGQGGQWIGMGLELLEQEPVFYKTIRRIDKYIQAHFGWSLLKELREERPQSLTGDIGIVQPALFAIQVALASLWQSWGIKPDAVVGHSMGEVAAAHVAGILSLEDAIQVICCRSRLLQQLRGQGSMLATELTPVQAKEMLRRYGNDIAIAAFNSPTSTVFSGNPEKIEEIRQCLQHQNLFCKHVNVDVASHSAQMDPLRPELLKLLDGLRPQPASLPFYSTVSGTLGDALDFTAAYWMDNLRKPVLFTDTIGHLLDSGCAVFMEIGPHPVLLGSIQQSFAPHHCEVRLLPSLRREEPEREVMLGTLGVLYCEGFSVAWDKLYCTRGKYIRLPLVPWQRQRYWMDRKPEHLKKPGPTKNVHPLLGERVNLAHLPSTFVWQTTLDVEVLEYLGDHRVEDEIVFPAAAYIEMALQAAEETGLNKTYELSGIVFIERMNLPRKEPLLLQALLSPEEGSGFLFSVYSRTAPEGNWVLHCSVTLVQRKDAVVLDGFMAIDPDRFRQLSTSQLTGAEFYQLVQSRGIQYGPDFRALQHIWSKDGTSLGLISLTGALQEDLDMYRLHPILLDAALQVVAALFVDSADQSLFVPVGCKRIRVFSRPDRLVWSHVAMRSEPASGKDLLTADITLWNDNGQPIAELSGFRVQRTGKRILQQASGEETWMYRVHWQARQHSGMKPIISEAGKQWLILADDSDLAEELCRQLEATGDHCYLLHRNQVFTELEDNPGSTLPQILDKLLNGNSSPLYGIIHLWSLSASFIPDISGTPKLKLLTGSESVLYLVQALARQTGGPPRLWVVTRGGQPITPEEPVAVQQSPVWGLGKVIRFELPELKCTCIDLDPQQQTAETVPLLIKQVATDDPEDQIAFRNGVRFVPRLLPFTSNVLPNSPEPSFRSDATYLITGGLGGLGLQTAKWMAQRGARHLVLWGRSTPSPMALGVVERLLQKGIDVTVVQADVSDATQVQQGFRQIEENMPALRGVIHAAGVLDDGSLLHLTEERMKKVMAPKVEGTWNLHQATKDLTLDFFVLFSSAVSLLGSPGQGNYAAASAYQDALAYLRCSLRLPTISINWGPWAEVGLAAEASERLKAQNASLQHLIKVIRVERGLEILGQLLTELTPQVMVLPFDLKNLIELYPAAAGLPFFEEVGGGAHPAARLYARPRLRQEYIAPRNELERKLAGLWQQTLRIDQVGIQDSFFELGGDSVLAAQILATAQKTFGIRIDPQAVFQAFTIERLAQKLEAELLARLEEMSEEDALRLLSKRT